MNIVVSRPLPDDALQSMRERGWAISMRDIDRRCPVDEMQALTKNADALLLSGTDVVDRHIMESASRLKVVATCSIGYDNIDVEFAGSRGIVVCNAPAPDMIATTAEAAVALLLSVAKRITRLHASRDSGLPPYSLSTQMGVPIRDRTCGIVGAGRIGSAIATIMQRGFDNRILYFSRSKKPLLEQSLHAESRELDALLGESDFVFVAVPLGDATRNLLSKEQLQHIKRGAIIVNVARAGIIDDAALLQLLEDGHLFGAGLDVYGKAAELGKHPNLILTSHMANGENVALRATVDLAVSNIVAVLEGGAPISPVTT